MATWTNSSRNSASFLSTSKSDVTTFGALTNDQIGHLSNDDILQGKPVGDWANDENISSTFWSNQTRN